MVTDARMSADGSAVPVALAMQQAEDNRIINRYDVRRIISLILAYTAAQGLPFWIGTRSSGLEIGWTTARSLRSRA
jgi:hypothetical protein